MPKLLIAEDNPINQTIIVTMLKSMGIVADTADNGKEAVNALENNRYDGILMDVYMPEMNGLQATEIIRKNFDAHQLPIIAVTADINDRELCLQAGMNDFMTKPIDKKILSDLLNKHNLL